LWMISLLHPSMAFVAIHSRLASAFLNWLYLIVKDPGLAFFRQVFVIFRISSVVLIVVGIGAVSSIVSKSKYIYSRV
jgi:hypothetical protein